MALALMGTNVAAAQNLSLPPEEVTNVSINGTDGALNITWDEADDPDGIVTGYKIYYGTNSVQGVDDYYDGEIEVIGDNTYTIEDLENGVEYFLALTAIDDEGYESETYSVEASGTPMGEPDASTEYEASGTPMGEPAAVVDIVIPDPEDIEIEPIEILEPEEPVIEDDILVEAPEESEVEVRNTKKKH